MTTTQKPHTAKCLRCGRTLTSSKSIADQMGRTCKAKVKAAANVIDLTEFKDQRAAKAKAIELIEQAGIVRASRPGLYLAVSSDGSNTYLIDTVERSCSCKGHLRTGHCYHMVAAHLIETRTAA